ncbi:butyrophilin subfamily 2 member A2-like isoform X5 [Lepisosteus oculatus]|uniref:butyrophilin subfamily 2 member A2-like isoform X5 n=1 Tax=Lepisosteus oculatus TaxID=7918 RepID=UPI003721ECBD
MKLELESVWILIILLSFLQIPVSISETFRVLGPAGPVVAAAGEDTVLPCYLSPSISVLDLEIRWFRGDFSELVFLYRKHKNLFDYQLPSYKGRTDLFPEEFPRGNASLSLKDVRGTDDGLYTCLVQSADWYKEAMIDLAVRALGTQPSVSLHSTGGGQTQLVCRSEGWFPAPAVTWTDRDGQDVTSLSSTTVERDSRGLLSVSSYLPVKQESNIFSCLVRSSVPYPDRGSLLHISEDISPGPSGWMVALLLTLILSVGLTNLLIKKWRKLHDFPQLHKELDRVTRCCKSGNVHCVGLANNIQQPYHPATHNWQPAEAKQV